MFNDNTPLMKKRIGILLMLATVLCTNAQGNSLQTTNQKTIDEGGSGPYKAIAVSEPSLPQFVVYRPKHLPQATTGHKKLPLFIWGNGGCSDTSVGYERMLTEVASQGYVVIAIGSMQQVYGDRPDAHTPSSMMVDAMDWICQQASDPNSPYFGRVDTTKMAAAGHSCGGAQVLCNAADRRLSTYLILNAGMGDMEMAGASKQSLEALHGPILYLIGGESDVAYPNAKLDFERISHVPVALGDMPKAGHGGTYNEKGGGDFGRMVIAWLDWHLKGNTHHKSLFLESDLTAYPGWTMQQKNVGTNSKVSEL